MRGHARGTSLQGRAGSAATSVQGRACKGDGAGAQGRRGVGTIQAQADRPRGKQTVC